ncbi:fatty acid oxidation complex subunit alpha FadJ [Haliangium ochraceum]|uniref:enoyl-CoA hydratase n=1 Tax=Haliangium ochraceum (strain DSM 14365 / JCM 11303 / SMP-2) TaxID=502025 RepID=D0LW26_HALO1|nr:fatty acid oxidation complex subunit alpha FadJ [Haliangium ochraceum]ACY15958.1 3-hydroxyacyl-CoA dehydrogenase NAD-binding protein [Haliangium ochraceum DSM 14365]
MSDTQAKSVSIRVGDDGVAVVTIDVPGQPVNTLRSELIAEFDAALSALEGDEQVRAAVIVSGKERGFVAGADIKELERIETAADGEAVSRSAQERFARLAGFRVPVVAAIHGDCLGGGLELALACHGRVASDADETSLGLPEVQLGLLPGAGGTQRLPRLIGLQAALDMILTGKRLRAKKARALGLVDLVVPAAVLERAARQHALQLAEARAALRKQRAGKGALSRMAATMREAVRGVNLSGDLQELVLEDNRLGRKVVFDTARKKLLAKTQGNYPAPEKALEAMRLGAAKPEDGYAAEARFFGELAVSPEANELIQIFLATTALKKDSGVSGQGAEARPRPVRKVAMLGAGLMGAGIAYVSAAKAGAQVRLKDRDPASVGRGLRAVREIVDGQLKRKRLSARQRLELMNRVTPTTDYSGFGDADVIIEAVFEDLALKRRIVAEVEAACGPETIFASNTSTIPIGRIAEASTRPETVIGMHYFSPVDKMPLLEIIVTEQTAPWVTATCVALGKAQGKTVIVVRDSVGFYTSRILGPYMNEAFHILAEGVSVERIDRALVDFGFPVGPVKLLDEVGVDVAHKAGTVMREAFGERMDAPPGMERLIDDERLGRKNQRGFYLYGGKKKGVDDSVYELLGVAPGRETAADEIAERCALQMVNEAAHCFGEGVLRSARDGDIGAIFGLGFPPFRGGPLRYVDALGAGVVVERLRALAGRFGKRFEPAPVLVAMADKKLRFYPDAAGQGSVVEPGRHR